MDVEPVAQQLRLGVGLILISVLIGLHQIYVSEPEPATETREYKDRGDSS